MYIWIFLATIMVALSFLNLSQRPDKDNTISEIKAASVVNKFRAEHTAMVKTMECEIILNHTDSWPVALEPIHIILPGEQVDTDAEEIRMNLPNLSYTSYEDNLPIGYSATNDLVVKHAVYCLKKRVETYKNIDPDNAELEENYFVGCNDADYDYTYIVSYVQIPEVWKTKGEDGTPLPTLINLLSKSTASTSGTIYGVGTTTIYGWTECQGNDKKHVSCKLLGNNARVGLVNNSKNKTGQHLTYDILDENSIMWRNNHSFFQECGAANTPCLFAYDHIKREDKGDRCYYLVNGSGS